MSETRVGATSPSSAGGRRPRVLSVQSHVVYGVVGNKAAVFPMLLRGVDVDPLNTCQLSNHTGYGKFAGTRTSAEDFRKIWDVLVSNGITSKYDMVLTGYVGQPETLTALRDAVHELKAKQPNLIVICDPVCGDAGRLYVPEAVPKVYNDFVELATVVTPNGFEAELLTGIAPTDVASASRCCDWFHERGVELVVVTSFESSDEPDIIQVIASHQAKSAAGGAPSVVHRALCKVPRVAGRFSGTGDLFAALVATGFARLRSSSGDASAGGAPLAASLGEWCSTLHAVLTAAPKATIGDGSFFELDLVGCQEVIAKGATHLSATAIE